MSATEAVAGIGAGERIYLGCGAPEPRRLVEAMVERAPALRDVEVLQVITLGDAAYAAPARGDSFRVTSVPLGADMRQAPHDGGAGRRDVGGDPTR